MARPLATAEPWHLWGNSQQLVVPADLFTNPDQHEQQFTLIRVEYGRPDSWRFQLSASIIDAPQTGPSEQANLLVYFELFAGVARSNMHIPFWVQFEAWDWNLGATVPRGDVKWATSAPSGLFQTWFDNQSPQVVTTAPVLSDIIVADHITIVAHAIFTTDIPNAGPATVEINGQVAPQTHIRPEWYKAEPEFNGGEDEGR